MVFPNVLDQVPGRPPQRSAGVVIGTALLLLVVAALVSPRTLAVFQPLLLVLVLPFVGRRPTFWAQLIRPRQLYVPLGILFGFALLSCLWTDEPLRALGAFTVSAGLAGSGVMTAIALRQMRGADNIHIAEGLWIGLIIGLSYLAIELWSHQAIKLFLYNHLPIPKTALTPPGMFRWSGDKLVEISIVDLTRSITPVTLFFWPVMLALRHTAISRIAKIVAVYAALLAVCVILAGPQETSKAALVAGCFTFFIARWNRRLGFTCLTAFWLMACLLPIPIARGMHAMGLQDAAWLQESGRARIEIWNASAETALMAPVLGHGFNSMMSWAGRPVVVPTTQKKLRWHPHAHNFFLQTWFELGAVGACLFAWLGLVLLRAIRDLGDPENRFAQATFASAATIIAASYGMWQPWMIALLFVTAGMLVFAVGLPARLAQAPRSAETLDRVFG